MRRLDRFCQTDYAILVGLVTVMFVFFGVVFLAVSAASESDELTGMFICYVIAAAGIVIMLFQIITRTLLDISRGV